MKLLVIGGAGHVGRILQPALQAEHDYTCFDRTRIEGLGDRSIVGDVGDTAAAEQAVHSMEAVVYLAMGTRDGTAATCTDLDAAFNVNVRDAYRFFSVALNAKVRRYVYVSTLSVYAAVFDNLTIQSRVDEQIKPNAWSPYGLSKRLGETLCEAGAQQYTDATIIALRLIRPCNEAQFAAPEAHRPRYGIGPNDLRRLFLAAICCSKPGAHIVQASGDLTNQDLSNARATKLLGWQPQGN